MNLLKKILPFKYKRSIKENLGVPSLHWSLQNLKKKGFNPITALDIGAYEGNWALDFLEVFPKTTLLMVEAQKSKIPFLEKIKHQNPNTDYVIALLSAKDGIDKYFCENETASHISKVPEIGFPVHIIKTRSLDSILDEIKFPLPEFLKLDVQGHELEVLKGAGKSLANASFCMLEISLLNLGDDCPLMLEMINYMDSKGFQAYDISHLMRRPFDKALYQIDMFFVKKDSFIIADKNW